MRGNTQGVVAYKTVRRTAGLLAAASAACMAGAAIAADDTDAAAAAPEISRVDVMGAKKPLAHDLDLSVMPASVQDTPQAISIVGADQMKRQGVSSLEQALRNVPGITVAIGEGGQLGGDQFKIRGFNAQDDVYIDGLRDFGSYVRDSFNYEEVQVLKGPSGSMFGRGTTGGAINTVSKQPRLANFTSVDAYAGNGDYYRALADINHQFGDTTAGRLALMYNDTGVVDRDHIYSKRWGAAINLATGIGTNTKLTFSYVHQHNKSRPDYGVIIVQKPGDIFAMPATEYPVGVERSTFTGFLDDKDKSNADVVTVRLSHKVNDKVTLTSDMRYGVYSRYFQYSTLDQCNAGCTTALFDGNPATEPAGGIGGSSPYDSDAWGLQSISTARIDYDVGSMRNQLIVGLDLSKQSNDKLFYAYTLPTGVTTRPGMPHYFVNPDPNFPVGYALFRAFPGQNLTCPATGNCTTPVAGRTATTNVAGTGTLQSKGQSTDVGIFLTDRLWVTEQVSVIGSMRLDRYTASLDSLLYNGTSSPPGGLKVKSTLKSPRASVVYEPADDQTYYVSWGKSETPQGTSIVNTGTALTISARDLEPETSRVWEAGAKFGIPGTRMSGTVSLFDVKKNNSLQTDPATGFLAAQSGEKQQVRGVELGLSGNVTDIWTLSLGYAYLDSKIKDSYTNCVVPTSTAGTPTGIVCPVGVTSAVPIANTVAIGSPVIFVPKHSATLYTTVDLGEFAEGLSVSGDAQYQSHQNLRYTARSVSFTDRSTLTPALIARAPSSFTMNASMNYHVGPYRLGVNVYNLANKLNYTQVFGNRATPAAGRTVIVSVGATF